METTAPVDAAQLGQLAQLFRVGGRGGGGFGGAGGAPLVDTGDYLVTLNVGGQRLKQVLRVQRVVGDNP